MNAYAPAIVGAIALIACVIGAWRVATKAPAQGIEAATAGETVKHGSTEGKSPVAEPCAQKDTQHDH